MLKVSLKGNKNIIEINKNSIMLCISPSNNNN